MGEYTRGREAKRAGQTTIWSCQIVMFIRWLGLYDYGGINKARGSQMSTTVTMIPSVAMMFVVMRGVEIRMWMVVIVVPPAVVAYGTSWPRVMHTARDGSIMGAFWQLTNKNLGRPGVVWNSEPKQLWDLGNSGRKGKLATTTTSVVGQHYIPELMVQEGVQWSLKSWSALAQYFWRCN